MNFQGKNYWALILGGSSGFGLASAKKLSKCGMNICVVHRDRKGSMVRIDPEFDEIKKTGVKFLAFNLDALSKEGIDTVLNGLEAEISGGKIRTMLHSVAFGSLKLIAPLPKKDNTPRTAKLAAALGIDATLLQEKTDALFADGDLTLSTLATPPQYNGDSLLEDDDLSTTIFAMGTSMLSWTKAVFNRGLFAEDARVLGLTSEGNEVAWYGYAAVSAAKVALEAISRSIAREFAPHGIRSNIVQPGVTDTPALRMIPGSTQLVAHAIAKNPFSRLTRVEDVAGVVAMLSSEEAAWINGSIIRADGGERISG